MVGKKPDDNMMMVVIVMMGGADGHDGHMFRINFLIWVFNLGILSFIFW